MTEAIARQRLNVILTASKVKCASASVHAQHNLSVTGEVRQRVQEALSDVDDWER